jgi:hypothetical protein
MAITMMSGKAKVGAIALVKVPEGKTPEHYLSKRLLEKEWAGELGTLAKFTGYRYRIGLDPSFIEERPEFKKGNLHLYEWILCENGGVISLYSSEDRIGEIWTTQQMGEKVLREVAGAKLYLTSDERLAMVIHFPLDKIIEVCELAGARRARRMSEEQKSRMREQALKTGLGSGKKGAASQVSGQATASWAKAQAAP